MMDKLMLITEEGKTFFIKNTNEDYHSQYGFIKKEDMKEGKVITNKGKEMSCIKVSFNDLYRKIKKRAQIIPLKDVSMILGETGITNNSIVVDAGVGSGSLAIFLAMYAKKVYSFDIRDDHIEIAEQNRNYLDVKNLIIKKHNVYDSIPKKDVDVITLDVPEPWLVIDNADKALKLGGYLVSYSPCIPQNADFVNKIKENKNFIHIKTIEISNREWEIEGRKIRPKTKEIGHSGFISIARKIF
jgi:tRNA (adenine57-N1/adenine58-N1)-methyltransferase catalytic subunit